MSTLVKIVHYPKEGGNSFFQGSDFILHWDRAFTTLTTFFSIFCHITILIWSLIAKLFENAWQGFHCVGKMMDFFSSFFFTTGSWGISPNHLRFWTLIWLLPTSAGAWGVSHHIKCTWYVSECVLIGLKAKSGKTCLFVASLCTHYFG